MLWVIHQIYRISMGVKNLHAALKHVKQDVHLSSLPGMRVAVDTSSFMMKGGVRHARMYFLGSLGERAPWAEYCLEIAILLREYGMTPVFVFDGKRLPIKQETCASRRDTRQHAKADAEQLESFGLIDEAEKKWQQAFILEQHMEDDTLDTLVTNGVMCCVSAYESDQQMAALWKEGIVDAVVTEDSDLLAYGVKRCIFKLKLDGHCEYYDALNTPEEEPQQKKRKVDIMLNTLSDTQIAQLCVLSGTDYNENVKGVGVKKVYAMLRNSSWEECLELLKVGPDLQQKMRDALHVFLHPGEYTKSVNWEPLKDHLL